MEKGVLYLRLTQLDLAIPLLEQAFQTALAQKNFKLALQTQIYLLRVWAEKENFFSISKLKVEIIEFALKNNISLESPFYYTIGVCSFYQNNFAEAKLYFETAHLKAQSETPIHQAHAELGLAIIKTESGELSSAIEHIQRAKHISHRLASTSDSLPSSPPSPDLKIMILLNEGKVLRCQKNYNKALELFRSALEIDKYHKNLFAYLYLLYEISLTYFSLNNFSFARLYLDLALNSCPEKELIRLEKLLKELKLKLADNDYDFLIHKTERKIVDRVRGEISFNRQELILDILLHLIENQGQAFSKEALCTRFWSERYKPETHDNKIYVTIKRLRNTIEDNLKKPRYILHSREGYYFNQTIKVAIQA